MSNIWTVQLSYVTSYGNVKCSWFIPLTYRGSSAQSSSRFVHSSVLGRSFKITSRAPTTRYYCCVCVCGYLPSDLSVFINRFLQSCCLYACPTSATRPVLLSPRMSVCPSVFKIPLPFSHTPLSHFVVTSHLHQLPVNSDRRNVFCSYKQSVSQSVTLRHPAINVGGSAHQLIPQTASN